MKRHEHPNAKRWLKAPTIEEIDAVVEASGASEPRFESFHGIYIGCIAHVRLGVRDMPLKHWHIFLDKTPEKRMNRNMSKTTPKIPEQRTSASSTSRLKRLIESSTTSE